MPGYLEGYAGRLAPAAARLAAVSLECRPALDIIREYGRHARILIYADPPYLGSVRGLTKGRQRGNEYACEMRRDAEHEALAHKLHAAAAAVVLSGYHSPLYERLYDGWHCHEIPTQPATVARPGHVSRCCGPTGCSRRADAVR